MPVATCPSTTAAPAGPAVQAANARQVRDGLVGQGISRGDIDRFLEVMADPDTIVGSSVLISAWGRRSDAPPAE